MSSSPTPTRAVLDISDMVNVVRSLNNAVFMAAGSLSDRDQMNAIQSVVDEIENKLLIIRARLEEVREVLA